MEWSKDRISTYVDGILNTVLYVPFTETRWALGNFPVKDPKNDTLVVVDPWSQTSRDATPFDQE